MGRHPKGFMEADTTPKNQRLSIAQLAAYDDLLTDVLVDKVYFWTNIKKNRTKYSQTRGFSEEQVCHILLEDIVLAKNVARAEAHLLELPGLKRYFSTLKSNKEREDFKKHMQKYISIWLPDCPFEVSTTNKYTITTHEASTTARRRISRGETIKYLCGNLVAMTPEEEKELDLNRRDFSVVKQVRKKISSLFLGPARFANHDCKANARLCQQGLEGMTIVATRDIGLGEEITVDYGDHYFNHNNRDCLCATCEGRERNGWAPETEDDDSSKPSDGSTGSSRASSMQSNSRKRSRDLEETLPADGVDERGRSSKQARLSERSAKSATGLHTPPDSTEKSSPRSEHEAYEICRDISDDGYGSSDREPARGLGRASSHKPNLAAKTISPQSFYGSNRPCNALSTSQLNSLPEGPTGKDPVRTYSDLWLGCSKAQSSQKTHTSFWMTPNCDSYNKAPLANILNVPGENFDVRELPGQHSVTSRNSTPSGVIALPQSNPKGRFNRFGLTPSTSSALSSVPPDFDENDKDETVIDFGQRPRKGRPLKPFDKLSPATKAQYMRRQSNGFPARFAHEVSSGLRYVIANQQSSGRGSTDDEEDHSDSDSAERLPRKPGDYIRTKALLGVPTARWVDCGTCDNTWVQTGKDTRRECPRCERHSKLYGFRWPKTEPKEKDTEKRIIDHRLINRTLGSSEEKKLPRRGRGLEKPENTEESRAASEEIEEDDGARRLRRTQARALGSGSKLGQELQEIDPKFIESSNTKIRTGKGWVMLVD